MLDIVDQIKKDKINVEINNLIKTFRKDLIIKLTELLKVIKEIPFNEKVYFSNDKNDYVTYESVVYKDDNIYFKYSIKDTEYFDSINNIPFKYIFLMIYKYYN